MCASRLRWMWRMCGCEWDRAVESAGGAEAAAGGSEQSGTEQRWGEDTESRSAANLHTEERRTERASKMRQQAEMSATKERSECMEESRTRQCSKEGMGVPALAGVQKSMFGMQPIGVVQRRIGAAATG